MKKILCFAFLLFSINVFPQFDFDYNIIMENKDTAQDVTSIAHGDLDNDGDLDMIATGFRTKWFENLDGNNNEISVHEIEISTEIQIGGHVAVYVVDIDNDADLDILIHNLEFVRWFENLDGLGTFGDSITIDNGGSNNSLYSISIIDFDDDSDLDIVYAKKNSSISSLLWAENDGIGNFTTQTILPSTRYRSIIVSDMDNDGDLDILGYHWINKEIDLEINDGMGNYTTQTIQNSNASDYGQPTINVVDLDNDNDLDLFLTYYSQTDLLIYFRSLKNDGNGEFSVFQEFETGENNESDIRYVKFEDLDGDNDIDLLFTSYENDKLAWFENADGNGTMDNLAIIDDESNGASGVDYFDYNNDGLKDIVLASKQDDEISWYQNLNDGNYSLDIPITTSINGTTVLASGDIDNDGDQDVLSFSYNDKKLAWYENLDGFGNFGVQRLIDTDFFHIPKDGLSLGDFDNDGDLDILSADSFNGTTNTRTWYKNLDGLGNFEPVALPLPGNVAINSMVNADMDNDNDLDVIYSNGGNTIEILKNINGTGVFDDTNPITISINTEVITKLVVEDLNGDGNKDIIAQSAYQIKLYYNDGNDNFSEIELYENFNDFIYDINVADLDGDNDLDIYTSKSINFADESTVFWLENLDGLGAFSNEQQISTGILNIQSISNLDMDNDSDMDIIIANYAGEIYWLENIDGFGNFGVAQTIFDFELATPPFIMVNDMNSDGKEDILYCSFGGGNFDLDFDKIVWFENIGYSANQINGFIASDDENDGCDSSDLPLPNLMVVATSTGNEVLGTFTLNNGYYQLFPGIGDYTVSTVNSLPIYYDSQPNTYDFSFADIGNTVTGDFCVIPIGMNEGLSLSITPTSSAIPGFEASYQIIYKNIGTETIDGSINYQYDNTKINFLNANYGISSQTSNVITFDFVNLLPFETRTINLNFEVSTPPTANVGDFLIHLITLTPSIGEVNTFGFNQTIIGSYDPNDITVLEGEEIYFDEVDNYLHYVIRFQNTGTNEAFNIRVNNILDDKLDWTTLQLENLSHDGRVNITNANNVDFIFENINLPDSISNEQESHGFIAYKIKPKSNVQIGDTFFNYADIYFDFNLPITTNTVSTKIVENLSIEEFELQNVLIYPNPTDKILHVKTKDNINISSIQVYNLLGQQINEITSNKLVEEIDMSNFKSGVYLVKVKRDDQTATFRVIKE
ncbi:T9SS type A sorting domain-containing protein [Winogradskyella sp.]|uniref:T9SS type A sorting domain-containing protein n=1 Tax=Winogradskyella sp. TaxID=1883156 RepID=UPI0026325710|nr:T9SS type A sorting domain-containing protein [Winogradskyella sp.]